jgi:hypothetical protein
MRGFFACAPSKEPQDVVRQEDQAPLCDGHALTNFAIVRTMVLNLLRQHGFDSITQGLRCMVQDIPDLFFYLGVAFNSTPK